jgi:long-subunit fatty acid transport protein
MYKKLLVTAVLTALVSPAQALTDSVINAGLQINFANPGARSLGMAGAFLGFSDDATAAYTNPAGLTALAAPEFAFEGRRYENSVSYVSGGIGSVAPDSSSGLSFSDAQSSTNSPSFFSFVYPVENWSFAVYRHELANYDNRLLQNTVFVNSDNPALRAEVFAQGAAIDVRIVNIGASAAYRLNDQWSLGVSVINSNMQFAGVTARLQGQVEVQVGDEDDWVYNLGLMYRASDQWSFGMAYRRGGDFNLGYAAQAVDESFAFNGRTSFNVPHQYGVGVAFRPTEAFAIGFEANHVRYSRLGEGFDSISFTPIGQAPSFGIGADNGTELRLGGEYVFANMERPFIVRAGVWRDPDHRLAYQGAPPSNFGAAAARVIFPDGDDEMHYSLGFGWAFEKFQIDAAADFSDIVDTYSVSGVFRF